MLIRINVKGNLTTQNMNIMRKKIITRVKDENEAEEKET